MPTFHCNTLPARGLSFTAVALAVAIGVAAPAGATENGGQRYSPGVGGSDMTSPLVPGWYAQAAVLAYHASKLKNNAGDDSRVKGNISQAQLAANPATAPAAPGFAGGVDYDTPLASQADGYAILPRITYLSARQWLGGNIGFTAMLPLVKKKVGLSGGTPTFTPGAGSAAPAVPGSLAAGLTPSIQSAIAARSSETSGVGDLEVSPIWHTEIGDHQHVTVAPTVVLPTGDYDKTRRANAGYGNFYTFRPSVQYAFIGNGWDLGARVVLSFNTRNKETDYKSGNVLNIDWAAMKFVSEDVRMGLQGYVVNQFTDDSSTNALDAAAIAAANGNRMKVYAAGPAVAWLKNGGEFLLEGKFLQEFGARNRTEGQTFWLSLSKPL